jgi:hypothetical protein
MKLQNAMIAAAAAFVLAPAPAAAQQMNMPAQPPASAQPPAATQPTAPAQPAPSTPAPAPAPGATDPTPAPMGVTANVANQATALATAADLKAGAAVYDEHGGNVGTVESADAKGAVIAIGKARIRIPAGSIGKNERGLVVTMTKEQLEAAAGKKAKS